MFVYAIFYFLLFCLLPQDAWAWGPGTHLDLALSTLAKLSLVAPAIRPLLKEYPRFFVYGAISADTQVGKKFAGYLHHCHTWRIGRLILNEATSDPSRAAAYGYLAHLAADVVAHSYYIPFKIIKSFEARLITHTYWELRFDLWVPHQTWKEAKLITERNFSEFDALLERVLKKTLFFSFKTHQKIFRSIVTIQKLKQFRKTVDAYAKKSAWSLEEENVRHYRDLSLELMSDLLTNLDQAAALKGDPTGLSRMNYAQGLRRRLKVFKRRKLIDEKQVAKLLGLVREGLQESLLKPTAVLPDVYDVM